MTDLVVCLGTGKGTWNYVNELIMAEGWDKVFVVTNTFGMDNFRAKRDVVFVLIDDGLMLPEMVELIRKQIDKKLGIEVALNLISGTGKEHMAILSALLKLGLAVRLIALTPEGVKEI